ncbi:MAG: hypothetical protein IKU52_01220 [Clostridia bacterium]|nr:hypothetical protein [Clostridia bacterium]
MANNSAFNVSPNFDINRFSNDLATLYSQKGFTVYVATYASSTVLSFSKDIGGINTILGMGAGIKATFTLTNNVLNVSFSDEEWTSKIIALVVGWFCCIIPFITGIIGAINQMDLPKKISNDAIFVASNIR